MTPSHARRDVSFTLMFKSVVGCSVAVLVVFVTALSLVGLDHSGARDLGAAAGALLGGVVGGLLALRG
jgi:hypothetical protein